MSSALGPLRGISQAFILIVAALVFAPGTARAQFPGYGRGYGFPGYGYASPFGYGMPGYGYGILNPFFGFGLTPLGIRSYFGYMAISPSRTCLVAASSRPLGMPGPASCKATEDDDKKKALASGRRTLARGSYHTAAILRRINTPGLS